MSNIFEFFERKNTEQKIAEKETAQMNKEINKIGEEHYNSVGDAIQEEILGDFDRQKYNLTKAPEMLSFMEVSIHNNPKDLFTSLKLNEFLDILNEMQKDERCNPKERQDIGQFLRDVESYQAVYSEKLKQEDMTAEEFMKFLSDLYIEASSLLKPDLE